MNINQEQQLRDREEILSREQRISPVSLSEEMSISRLLDRLDKEGKSYMDYIKETEKNGKEIFG